MEHIVRKAFWDYEKEEQWLNEMAAKGWALKGYSWCKYVFEETPKNEYVYRIEFLDNLPAHPESGEYIAFLEENGIEHVASYTRWIYLRKKAAEGEFELYTDIGSKIKHYEKINTFWTTLALAEFAVCLVEIVIGLNQSGRLFILNLVLSCMLAIMGILLLGLGIRIRKKIRRLHQEKAIRE